MLIIIMINFGYLESFSVDLFRLFKVFYFASRSTCIIYMIYFRKNRICRCANKLDWCVLLRGKTYEEISRRLIPCIVTSNEREKEKAWKPEYTIIELIPVFNSDFIKKNNKNIVFWSFYNFYFGCTFQVIF